MRGIWRRVVATLRRDFVAGLLVSVPVGFTILGLYWIVDQLDRLVLPKIFASFGLETRQPPFVGAVLTLALVLVAGALTRSFIGRGALHLWERAIERVPIARSLYSVLKQFMEAIFGRSEAGDFQRVVLIEYPRRGVWSYAFVTGRMNRTYPGMPERMATIFIPSTPNPTTGYFLMLPEEDLIETGLSVEDAFRLIISAGMATGEEPKALEKTGSQ